VIHITKIYLITNCYNDPNKVYIGKTKNSRKYEHLKRFGSQIEYNYIDEINSLNKTDWEPLESYWIEQFRQWGFEVMNVRKKGGSGPEYQKDITRLKISESLLGKKVSEETKLKISLSQKGKIKHTLESKEKISKTLIGRPGYRTGKILSEESKNKISLSLTGKPKSEQHKQNLRKPKPQGFGDKLKKPKPEGWKSPVSYPINQFDKQGKFIKEWVNGLIASKELNLNYQAINNCLLGKTKTSGGFIWKISLEI
jgi:hypothetical protein